jgi:hypothetical protein
MSAALMEATEEACFSAATPTSRSTAAAVNKAAVRLGRKGMFYIRNGEDEAEIEILGVLISHG